MVRRSSGKQRRRWWLTGSGETATVADNRSPGGLYSRTCKERGWNGLMARCSCLAALGVPEQDNHARCRPKQGGQWPAVASASMGQSQLHVKGTRC
jgi:hypothetical protein